MKHWRGFYLFLIICSVFSGLTVFAQQNSFPGSETTIEELYLQNIEMSIIREQAVTLDRETKLLSLENIEQLIDEGKITKDSADALYLLDYLAMEGVNRQVRMNGRQINNFPEVRRKACNLLGKIGGETAKTTLLDVYQDDNEPMVLAEAAYALGEIGLNENEEVTTMLAFHIREQTIVKPDDNLAFAVMLAFEKIAEENGGIKNPMVYDALIQISQGNYIREVRMKALQVMEKLRAY